MPAGSAGAPLAALSTRVSGTLAELDQEVDAATRIGRIRTLERLRSVLAAAQARETAAFAAERRAARRSAGVPAAQLDRGIAAEIGLARKLSPHRAARYVGACSTLTTDLPKTFAALRTGRVSEWRALLVARETGWLTPAHRRAVDDALAPRLGVLGDRRLEAEVRSAGYRLDPVGCVQRARAAAHDRRVSLRPAPEAMARLTALLPLTQGVACYAALSRAADSARSNGDGRGRGQVMADTLVERITGQASAQDVPLAINLVLSDETLFGAGARRDAPASVFADGVPPASLPAELARRAAIDLSGDASVFVRRLYTRPDSGELAAMDSSARAFTANQRLFLLLRDAGCRTPYCDAAIRHTDHVVPVEQGGKTQLANGQGLCEACNYAKQAPGWRQRVRAGEIVTRTPTGHRARSVPTPINPPATAPRHPTASAPPSSDRVHRPAIPRAG